MPTFAVTEKPSEGKHQEQYGSLVPWAEPYWYNRYKSPYYGPTHHEFRVKVRTFVEKSITPFCHEWDEKGSYPLSLHKDAYKAGIYSILFPAELGGTPPADFDAFHDLIFIDEISRCGAVGLLYSCFFSIIWSLPPIIQHGTQYLKDKVARPVISGDKIMALAISEPWVGSDVARLRTTAVLSDCKKFYIVNGAKKWISSGTKAHFFTVAVRTGGKGMGGISMLLMERGAPGFRIRRMKTQGGWMSGTAYLNFEDVKVPVEHLIGKENAGFKPILKNFNHERFLMAGISNRSARLCLEDSIKYARVRKTFGKRLIDHQTIRHKIAEMARQIEATHAFLEQVAYQYKCGVADKYLGGPIALLKVQATKTWELCNREAAQILGGNAYIRGGKGAQIERLYREVRLLAISGGSEEILLDLAGNMAKL